MPPIGSTLNVKSLACGLFVKDLESLGDGVPSKVFEGYIPDSNLQSLLLDLNRVRSSYHLHGYHKPLHAFPSGWAKIP